MSLINSKALLELYDLEIHKKISVPNYQKLKNHGEKMSINHETLTPGMGELKQEQWSRIIGD